VAIANALQLEAARVTPVVFRFNYDDMPSSTLTFDPLTLKVRGTSSVTWSKSVRNLSDIEQSTAELLIILRILHTLCYAVTLTFDLLTLNFYNTSVSCV